MISQAVTGGIGGSAAVANAATNKASTMQRPIAEFPRARSDMCRRNRLDLSNSLYGYIHYYHCWGELHLRLSLSSGRHLLGTNSGRTMLTGLSRAAHQREPH